MFSKTKTKGKSGIDTIAPATGKTDTPTTSPKKEAKTTLQASPPSIISVDMTVTGDFVSDGEIQVDGKIKGDVHCSKLTIGQRGTVEGTVCAERALLRGKIVGQIEAQQVTLMSTATVIGDIVHEALTIEPGAHIEGHCKRLGSKQGKSGPKIDLVVDEDEFSTA